MSRRTKDRLRLVDPNEHEVSSDVSETDVVTSPKEERAMERTLLQQLGATDARSNGGGDDEEDDHDRDVDSDDEDFRGTGIGDADASTTITAPRRTIRNRTAEEERKAQRAQEAAAAAKARAAAASPRKNRTGGGLLSRLRTIAKKEQTPNGGNAPAAPAPAPAPAAVRLQGPSKRSSPATSSAPSPSSPAAKLLPVGGSTSSPRPSTASSRKSAALATGSRPGSGGSSGRSTPTSPLPGPSETLGIRAFQRHRVSTNASLATTALLSNSRDNAADAESIDLETETGNGEPAAPPSLSALHRGPLLVNTALAATPPPNLRDQGVEKQPDLIEKSSAHLRRSSTQRYSIAHSVEASLEDSWSIAERGDGMYADEDADEGDDYDDDRSSTVSDSRRPEDAPWDDFDEYSGVDWLKSDVGPPMVGPSVVGSITQRPAPSHRTVSAATMRTARSHSSETEGEGESDAGTSQASQTTFGNAGRRGAAAAAAALPAALYASKQESSAAKGRALDDDEDDDAAQTNRQSDVTRLLQQLEVGGGLGSSADKAPRPSSIATTDIYTQVSATDTDPLYPDDSVSIRAAHRAAALEQAEAEHGVTDDEAPTPTLAHQRATKSTNPAHLQAVLADIEPALQSDSEEEICDEDDDDDTTDTELQERRPPIVARPRRQPRQRDSIASDVRRPRNAYSKARGTESWLLDSAMTPEQYHYFVKAMVASELQWEAERAFVFDPSDEDRGSADPAMKIKEYAVFRRSSLAPEHVPALPLVRFLFDTVFCMLPAFGHAQTSFEKRKQRAEVYWKRGVAPLLRILQSRSLSHRVDRYGPTNGKPFNAQGTSDVVMSALKRAAASYITATLRLDGPDDVKQSWPWPSAGLMKLPAFTPYRLSPEKQTRGGYEVDIACVRPAGAQTSYIISVKRRFGHPLSFVLRSESQFYELGKALFLSLPGSHVKPPPALDMAIVKAHLAKDGSGSSTAGSNAASSTVVAKSKASTATRGTARDQSPNPKAKGNGTEVSGSRSAAEQTTNGAKPSGLAGLFGSLGRSSASANAKGSTGSSVSAAPGNDGKPYPALPSPSTDVRDSVASKKRASLLGSRTSLPLSPDDARSNAGDSTSPLSPTKPKNAPPPAASTGKASRAAGLFGLGSQAPPPSPKVKVGSIDYALRRLQLRDWLRDTLSARGVGHHPETRNFFSVGAFTERDLKKSTKEKIEANRRADEIATKQREEIAVDAGEEVLDLRDQIDAMWEECKLGDGFLRAKTVFTKSASFSGLPEDYQRLVTYLHLQAARMLDGIFITGDQSAVNFRRAKAVLDVIPWKLLRVVISQPTGLMVADLKRSLSHPSFISKLLNAALQDDPRRIEDSLSELKGRLPSIYLRKLRRFVEVTPDDVKRLIRDHAVKADIPLVAAIERGSDSPLLEGRELSRIISATKTWKSFMDTSPTAVQIQMEAGRNRDVALIRDLQQALRLYSLRRDGASMRDLVRSKTFRTAVESLTQPLVDYAAKLHHRRKPLKRFVKTLEMRLHSLFELIEALRNRVHDPARSIEALTTYFDSHVQDSMSLIRILSPLFTTLHHMAHTIAEGSPDLASEWSLPTNVNAFNPLNDGALGNIKSLADSAWLRRIRAMEVTSRWIAGDLEADQEVQVIGGEGELSRTAQILPDEPESTGLDREYLFKPFGPGFRAALAKVLNG